MKYILLLVFITFELFASVAKTDIVSVESEKSRATVKIDKIDIGMSGVVVHAISNEHSSILKNAEVIAYDKKSQIATLKLSDYISLKNNYLPHGKWKVSIGDSFEFARNYSRALLIAPDEEIYHKITKSVSVQWIHPDLFATLISYKGDATPLQEDFKTFSVDSSVGLLFIYLNQKIYTLDIKSFKILSISDAPLKQSEVKLPFYSRIGEISASWFGKGSSRLKSYEPHYYELLVKNNTKNKKLYEIIKNGDKKFAFLLDKFEIGE